MTIDVDIAAGGDGVAAADQVQSKASRHRHPCRLAVMQQAGAGTRRLTAGVRPGCDCKEALPCARVAKGRRTFWFKRIASGDAASCAASPRRCVARRRGFRCGSLWTSLNSACDIGAQRLGARRRGQHHRVPPDRLFHPDRDGNGGDAAGSVRQARGSTANTLRTSAAGVDARSSNRACPGATACGSPHRPDAAAGIGAAIVTAAAGSAITPQIKARRFMRRALQ